MSTQPSHAMKLLVLAALVCGLSACTADFAEQNTSPVLFRIADINGGSPLDSDVLSGDASSGFFIEPDLAPVTLAVRPKNQNFDNTPQVPAAVFVERYEIRYFRSDGRSTEGVDVPYRISGNLTTVVDVGTGGADNVTVDLEVVRRQAKLEPPLRNLVGSGGEIVLTCFAEVTIHGRTTVGQAVQDSGRIQIDFADLVQ